MEFYINEKSKEVFAFEKSSKDGHKGLTKIDRLPNKFEYWEDGIWKEDFNKRLEFENQAKTDEINNATKAKIFKKLNVETTEQALIAQVMQLSEAVAFLATKTDKRTLSEAEKSEIGKQLKDFESIKKAVDNGRKLKTEL